MMTIRRVFRSLTRRPRYASAFLIAGVLGLSGNLYLNSLEGSIRQSLRAKSRDLLTADISISVRRLTTEEDRGKIDRFLQDKTTARSRALDLFSMLKGPAGSRLVQLLAVEENYPLVGRLTLEKAGPVSGSDRSKKLGAFQIWIDPDVRDTLGLRIGDRATLGDKEFTIADVVVDDTASTWRSFSLAPRILTRLGDLQETGLLRKGSTVFDRSYALLKEGEVPDTLAKKWNAEIDDPAIRAIPHEEASEQVAKLSSRLNDYLGLVGITTLFLAIIGMAFLFQTELRRRLPMIGTLRALGDSNGRVSLEIASEASVLGAAAGIIAITLVSLTLPVAAVYVARLSGVNISPTVSPFAMISTIGLGALLGFLISYPFTARVARVKPSALFQDEMSLNIPTYYRDYLRFLPLLILFYFLSVYYAHSWKVGSVFFGMSFVSVLILFGVGGFLFARLERVRAANLPLRIALRSLARNPWSSLSGFVAIGIGALLLSLIPEIQRVISSEIERPEGSSVPSLFLFDIQEEQVAGVEAAIRSSGGEFKFKSPLVRARLETIRGEPVEKTYDFSERSTREQEEEERSRNRGFNLSYRAELADSEAIVEGRNFLGRYVPDAGPPEVTLEKKYAERLGVKIGDLIGFDVQGVPVEAKIVGLRRVRWSSFQPNFFVLFQPGVLEDAPKTYLGGVPALASDQKRAIQMAIVSGFPNVAIIQVEEMVRKIVNMFDQMGFAIRITALLSLLTGIFVVFSIARRQVLIRRRGILLLRSVGASTRDVLAIFLWEFGLLAAISSAFGVGLSFLISRILAWTLFDRAEVALSMSGIYVILGVSIVSVMAVSFAAVSLLREKPWRLLQSET